MARWSELRPSNSSCKASLTESVVVEFNKAIVLLVRPGRLSRARNDDGPSMRRTAARPCSRSVVVVALAHTTCSSFVTRDRYTPLDGRHLIRPTRQCISPQRLYDGDQQLRVEQDQQALASKPRMLAHCKRRQGLVNPEAGAPGQLRTAAAANPRPAPTASCQPLPRPSRANGLKARAAAVRH